MHGFNRGSHQTASSPTAILASTATKENVGVAPGLPPHHHVDGGGFAGPVGPQQAEALAPLNAQVQGAHSKLQAHSTHST